MGPPICIFWVFPRKNSALIWELVVRSMKLNCAGHGCFVSKLQWSKLQIAGLKEEFAGLKMGPFGGPVFGAAFLGKREK